MKKSAVILTVAAAVGITAAVVAGIVFSNGGAESIAKGTTAFEESSAYVDRESSSWQAQTEKSSETVKKPATTKKNIAVSKENTTSASSEIVTKSPVSFTQKNVDPVIRTFDFDETEKKYPKVFEAIRKGYDSHSSKIRLYDYNISYDELKKIIACIGLEYDYFYVGANYEYSQKESETRVVDFSPKYIMNASRAEEYGRQISAQIDKIAAAASKMKTDTEKLLYIHDYIIDNTVYNTSTPMEQNNIYGALILKNTLCTGYAEAFSAVAEKLGFKSYIITSQKINHAWNLVMLNGRYYHIDCAWDDPEIVNKNLINNPVSGFGRYLNFLVSDSKAYSHDHASDDWVVNAQKAKGAAVSKFYDNFFWHDFDCLMRYSNGFWYHSVESEKASKIENVGFLIEKIAFTNSENYKINTCRSIKTCWAFGNSFYPLFSSTLQEYNGAVYYMKADGIYKLGDGGALNGSGDRLVFKNPRRDSIYDFVIDPSNGVFTVAFGTTTDNSSSNAAVLKYKISDYKF